MKRTSTVLLLVFFVGLSTTAKTQSKPTHAQTPLTAEELKLYSDSLDSFLGTRSGSGPTNLSDHTVSLILNSGAKDECLQEISRSLAVNLSAPCSESATVGHSYKSSPDTRSGVYLCLFVLVPTSGAFEGFHKNILVHSGLRQCCCPYSFGFSGDIPLSGESFPFCLLHPTHNRTISDLLDPRRSLAFAP
jgi:hypothetical protein